MDGNGAEWCLLQGSAGGNDFGECFRGNVGFFPRGADGVGVTILRDASGGGEFTRIGGAVVEAGGGATTVGAGDEVTGGAGAGFSSAGADGGNADRSGGSTTGTGE